MTTRCAGPSTTLPAAVARVRAGRGDVLDAPVVHDGQDEIDEVAAAFDRAQHTALQAAAGEAAARTGFTAVFLNIAHRSQSIVHRQLKVLDEVERAETDPDQLARLFQLDHLATRERRNAENLIVLGGGTPGRQWREPVPLIELIRSAISEAVHYNRVEHGRIPAVPVVGPAVADLIHLLAELLDNATAFSPPDTPILVRGNLVGRGLVVEIEDQGLGIPAEQREQLNTVLSDPPDFGVHTLSEDTRLGLFVVARLAHRHGIRITLLESAYGGVRAVVLVPADLLAVEGETADTRPVERRAAPPARRPPRSAPDGSEAAAAEVPGDRAAAPVVSRGAAARATWHPASVEVAVDPARPVLPQRRRMDHLVPQLSGRPTPAGSTGDEPATGTDRPPRGRRRRCPPRAARARRAAARNARRAPVRRGPRRQRRGRHDDHRQHRALRTVAARRPRRPHPRR